MTKPEPVLDEPRRAVAANQPAVAVRTPTPSGFDPKDRFFPQALLEQFDETPAAAPVPGEAGTAGRPRAVSIALLALIVIVLAAWWGMRSTHRPAPVVEAKPPPPSVAPRPVAAIVPVAPPPASPAPGAASTPAAGATPSSPPSAVVPAAITPIRTGVAPVTHTRAAHAAPPAPVKEETKPAPVAPPADCAPSIAALDLCGSANRRKGS